jgi:alpha-glucosidase (family GH31 glycosyl hydrolase)
MNKALRRITLPFAILTLLSAQAFGQSAALALSAKADGLTVKVEGITAEVSLATGDLLRITATLDGTTSKGIPDAMMIPIARAPASPSREKDSWRMGPYSLRTDGPSLLVARDGQARFRIRFEKAGAAGIRTPLVLEKGDAFYGMGQCVKSLALGEQYLRLYNRPSFGDQTYLYVPYFFGSAGDAFLFQAAGNDVFVFRNAREATPASEGSRIDLAYWHDANPASLTSRLYSLTGSRTLLPRWAYGYIQSKYGYRTDAEVRTVVSAFGQFKVPLDAIVLDLYWFSRMGDLDWNRQSFPDPVGLDAWLEKSGVKLISISEPFFTLDSKLYRKFAAAGLFATGRDGAPMVWNDWWSFGGTGGSIVNPLAAGVEKLLGDRYVALARMGVDGFWTDLGEPEKVPAAARFGPWSEMEFHQAFNKEWSRLVHDAWAKAFPGTRPFILSRSGYLGSTGYGVSIWSGDVPATWDGLKAQVPLGLQAGLSGFPFWGSDAGGFITSGGELMPPDPELYLRWLQFASCTPVFRAHGTGPREPWIYGEEWLARARTAIGLRTVLLPYVYSTAYQVWSEGLPMMRPLFFLDPADPHLTKEDASFMLGDWLLVSPVTQPLAVATKKKIYLPKGSWYNLSTMERYKGGREIDFPLSLDAYPVFAREGAIIPAHENDFDEYLLIPGPAPTRYTVFTDDGSSEAYLAGGGEKLKFTLDGKGFAVSGAAEKRDIVVILPKRVVKLKALAGAKVAEDPRYWIVKVTADAAERRYEF